MQQSHSAPAFSSSQNFSNDDTLRNSQNFNNNNNNGNNNNNNGNATVDRVTNELKRMWQNALRACKHNDDDKSGFVKRDIFLSVMDQHLGKSMTSDAINSLANTYAAGDDVDYHTCFRTNLNNIMNGPTSTNKSVFQIAPLTKSREVGASHPWDFNYQLPPSQKHNHHHNNNNSNNNNDEGTTPYWKRACVDPRARPSTTLSSSLDSGGSITFGFSKTLPSNLNSSVDISSYDPKVVNTCRKVISNPSFRQLKDELKRSQLINYKGCISVKNWTAILSNFASELTRSENGALQRVFRAKGIPDTINYKEFLDLCYALK
eukprot:CAMPEP_0174818530 /NCGR_PEP_ID=MMETSP1107-20130205/1233_1 /TAXON_ID=36770 /ORGANISM="Paraphysomonas vestita, Strain GFlagA" /LENGTH=317 /DNA_ID=CAMNT_0016030485 /DNA_START=1512 /DNA_END=2465 /DNA_ORIENTATION=+